LWTSEVRPGREHDTTALREHLEILPALKTWIAENRPALGDLGYEGEAGTITVAFKKPKGGELTDEQKTHNKAHNGKRAIGERGNSLLKMTFKALRNISLCPWRIGKIVAAALVLLHTNHDRTTWSHTATDGYPERLSASCSRAVSSGEPWRIHSAWVASHRGVSPVYVMWVR
jgi:hypothetical protein